MPRLIRGVFDQSGLRDLSDGALDVPLPTAKLGGGYLAYGGFLVVVEQEGDG